ncbi:hypothetical protein [Coleofasciculus sp. FACHB-1120]|uniref:hypothetical protein n=1 Tax=Coleofasciculus sp. FACHB-1120 TaxID=2692783 RepID=UPI0016847461|nr:hypothetical protein [Coleofasciculus sp. FACHB-1120]MBD2742076.1 hypothetical protein [Coleofasciculus sp. FACHB-1120]
METVARESELQVLGRILQNRLYSALPEKIPFQVRCALPQEALIILTQHPADFLPDSQQTFRTLEQTLKSLQPEFAHQVQIYLRVVGQKQPYAFHAFSVDLPVASTSTTALADEPVVVEETIPNSTEVKNPPKKLRREKTIPENLPSDTPAATDDRVGVVDPAEIDQPSTIDESSSLPADELTLESDEPSEEVKSEAPPTSLVGKLKRLPLPVLLASTGVGLLTFLFTLYALTRPCVIGTCTPLLTAQALTQEASATLQRPKTGQEILEARQKQQEAIRLLKLIPFWSGSYSEAQKQLTDNSQQAELLDQLVMALSKGSAAARQSQNPPHSATEWLEIQKLWREAIALLEPVPKNSTVYQLAQQKIKDYRTNLAATNGRVNAERQALKNLDAAKEGLQVAEAREGVANSIATWRLAETNWEMAINRLKAIPVGTTARPEAQQLLATNLPKLSAARDRKNKEQMAANAYNFAQNIARSAKNYEQLNQWTLAVMNWRNAIVNLQKIPRGTFFYNQGDALISSYKAELRQAEIQLGYASLLQKASTDLVTTCAGTPKVCEYTVTSQLIRVQLTPAYMQMVTQTVNAAQLRGDSNAQAGIATHLRTLGDALEAISDNARIPLELYTPDGSLVNKYPKVS